MAFTKEDHHETLTRKLAEGTSFKSRISTGALWPKDVHARYYQLRVTAVSPETVTFSVTSNDAEPHTRRRYNFLEHGEVEVLITEDMRAIVRAALQGVDPEFFERYPTITNLEAWQRFQENGPEFSSDYDPKKHG